MSRVALACALALTAGACSKERVKECDAFVATIEKIEKCDKLDASARDRIKGSAQMIKNALKMLDDAGGAGNAPEAQLDQLRQTCKSQHDTVVELYGKVAPDCLK